MDVISDHSQASGEQPSEPQFDRRIRWGNVALALAALVAIVAAVGLPRGGAARSAQHSAVPATELVTDSVPTPPTAVAPRPHRRRSTKERPRHKSRSHRQKNSAPRNRPVPATPSPPTPTPTPAPAPPAPDQTPAAEREFGL